MKLDRRSQDLAAIMTLALGWLAVFLYIDPRGGFSLNDDFQYAESVRRWSKGAGLTLSQWGLSTSVTHLALGRFAAIFMSPDNWHLRLLMLGVGLATAVLFYFFLRDLGLEPSSSLAGTGVLALNPVYMTMSASFHLDITAAALQIAAGWAFLRALRGGGAVWRVVFCSALLGLGILTRQTAAFSAGGALFVLWRREKLNVAAAAALLAPAGLAAGGFWLWLHLMPRIPWAWQTQLPSAGLKAIVSSSAWRHEAKNINASIQTAALFLCPLVFGLTRKDDWRRPRKPAAAAAAGVAFLAICGWMRGERMPLLGNTLSSRGLGVVTLAAPEAKAAWAWSFPPAWRAVDLLCVFSAIALALIFFGEREPRDDQERSAALWFGLPPYAAMLVFSLNFDRYLLTVLPFLIAALLLGKKRKLRLSACALGCLLLAAASTAGLRDYFAWNRARWEAGMYGVRLGLAPAQIENGFDWDGQYTLERDMSKLLSEKPASEIGKWDWMKENKVLMITSFSRTPPKDDFKLLERFPYQTPLADGPAFVYLYGQDAAFKPRR